MKNAEKNSIQFISKQIIYFLFVLFSPVFCFAQDSVSSTKNSRIQLHGYIKDMQSVSFINNAESLLSGNFIHNRINLKWNISDNLYLRAEARNRLFYGEQVKTTYQFGKLIDIDNGRFDLSYNLVDESTVVLNTILDRALLNWSTTKCDVTIGRQRINWGVNLVWNPNDIFNAFNYFDFDYEERPGTDAIRVQYSTGSVSSLELAYKVSDNEKEQVGALMYKTNFRKYDLQNFAGIYFEDIVVGTGWAGSVKNTGFKGEGSYFHPYRNISDSSGVLSASVSLDRSFKNDYFASVSYLFNSQGKGLQSGINELTNVSLSSKKLMPFKHSFFAQVSKSFNPLLNGSIAGIFSPERNTLILLPSIALSISDDWDIALIAQSFFADVDGVYRSIGNGIYLRLRWSY